MRSTPEMDAWLRERLQLAVTTFAGGSQDKLGRMLGYTNGGYIREILNGKKPVREAIIERANSVKELAGWFDLPGAQAKKAGGTGGSSRLSLSDLNGEEGQLVTLYRQMPKEVSHDLLTLAGNMDQHLSHLIADLLDLPKDKRAAAASAAIVTVASVKYGTLERTATARVGKRDDDSEPTPPRPRSPGKQPTRALGSKPKRTV